MLEHYNRWSQWGVQGTIKPRKRWSARTAARTRSASQSKRAL